jgi:hypothetical protein
MRKPGNWLISVLESVEESNGQGRTDPGFFHPSDFGHICDAYMAFKFLGAPAVESIPARLRRIFDHGSGRDYYLKADSKKAGISLIKKEADRKISIPHLHIRGELDEWVINPANGRKYVVDFKTMNTNEFQALKEVKSSHHKQVHPYMKAKETYEGIVLYEDKNDQNLKAMPADFDKTIWQDEIVDRVDRVLHGIRTGYIKRTPIANDASCPFYNICTIANLGKLLEESGVVI